MTRRWHFWAAVMAVVLVLGVGVRFLTTPGQQQAVPALQTEASPTATPTPSAAPPAPTPTATPTATAPTTAAPPKPSATPAAPTSSAPEPPAEPAPTTIPPRDPGPPSDTDAVASRYRNAYDGRYVSWNTLIDRGKALPAPSASCTKAWRSSGKDSGLDWSDAEHWCLSSLNGRAYKPQGVGGSSTAVGYDIGGQLATDRNLVLITWYSRVKEKARFANSAGESATKMTVIDLDRRRYNTVELVRPSGGKSFANIDSHGSGVAWAGQYLYTSSLSVLWMYNADDLMQIDGRFVLPAVSRWSASGRGGLSSISVDHSTGSPRLSSINFTPAGNTTYVQSFALSETGRLRTGTQRSSRALTLRNTFGPDGTVHSYATSTVTGSNFQGVARHGSYTFANSSHLRFGGRGGDATVVQKEGRVIKRLRMPRTNVESIYLDQTRNSFVSVTEHDLQFLFTLPLASLITAAER